MLGEKFKNLDQLDTVSFSNVSVMNLTTVIKVVTTVEKKMIIFCKR